MVAADESLFKISYVSSVKRGSYGPRGPEEGKRAPYRRHEVPGFWRRQAYGPGRSLRRRIYINDFERGHGELVPKTSMTKVTAVNSDTLDKVMA
ncbi:hypothetical protein LH464_23455 [Neorhizobium sp. T786]|uniref:hypothetical protein n=1 Tax=Pseudorhizobium xiangyangii TaxID=2883104 RepID=UPI001D0001F3|nr:hypothetical protein [Neorhizobium xiangyangii]MCB5205420.1 hypothetical protein [Neorhizobium xiangyangii]